MTGFETRRLIVGALVGVLSTFACELYDSSSDFAELCEFYERCGKIEESEVSSCIDQHEELYDATWGEQAACADPETNEPLYPPGHFADLCSAACQDASRAYLLCIGSEGGACESEEPMPEACEDEHVDYLVECPGLSADEPSTCGNGLVEADEQCDDGNSVDDDDCDNACVEHCGLRELVHGSASSDLRRAGGAAVDGHGDIVLAGSIREDGAESRILVEKYAPDGSVFWQVIVDSAAGPGEAVAVAVDGSNNVVVVGELTTVEAGPLHAWLGKYGDEGGEVWTQDLGADLELRAVGTAPGGELLVSGTVTVDGGEQVWLRKLSGAGEEAWTSTFSHDQGVPEAQTIAGPVAVGPGGDGMVLAEARQDDGTRRVGLLRFSDSGDGIVDQSWLPDHGVDQVARAIVHDGERSFVGIEEAGEAGIWIIGIDDDGSIAFTVSGPEVDALAPPTSIHGIDLAGDGSLVIGGTGSDRRWLGRMAPWGDILCASAVELEPEDPDPAYVVDGGASSGDSPLAAGYSRSEQQSSAWFGFHRP
jgi:cysteine-rich repeat protein